MTANSIQAVTVNVTVQPQQVVYGTTASGCTISNVGQAAVILGTDENLSNAYVLSPLGSTTWPGGQTLWVGTAVSSAISTLYVLPGNQTINNNNPVSATNHQALLLNQSVGTINSQVVTIPVAIPSGINAIVIGSGGIPPLSGLYQSWLFTLVGATTLTRWFRARIFANFEDGGPYDIGPQQTFAFASDIDSELILTIQNVGVTGVATAPVMMYGYYGTVPPFNPAPIPSHSVEASNMSGGSPTILLANPGDGRRIVVWSAGLVGPTGLLSAKIYDTSQGGIPGFCYVGQTPTFTNGLLVSGDVAIISGNAADEVLGSISYTWI